MFVCPNENSDRLRVTTFQPVAAGGPCQARSRDGHPCGGMICGTCGQCQRERDHAPAVQEAGR